MTLKKLKRELTNCEYSDAEMEARPHNTGLAKVAVQCSADTFVVNQSLVLRINPARAGC
jgi:hypothetical protein